MKRRITLVIALTLSFLMMFSSVAKAEEIKIKITVTTSESGQIEVVKAPPVATNKADSPLPQVKAKVPVLQEGEQTSKYERDCLSVTSCGECKTDNGTDGMWETGEDGSAICQPCNLRTQCGECTTSTGACGIWQTGLGGKTCVICSPCGVKL